MRDRALARMAHDLMREHCEHVGYIAVERGLLRADQLDECLAALEEEAFRRPLGAILVERRYLTDELLAELLAEGPAPDGVPEAVRAAQADPQRCLGRFILVEEAGHGGSGRVWRAWDAELRRWVAVKLLERTEPAQQERFLREARIAARLSHPGIVPVYEIGEHEGRPYIVMQLIDGTALTGLRMNPREVLQVMVRIAEAVEYAHSQHVIHRDLKPHNVLRDRTGAIYVTDFGLARPLEASASLTAAGAVLGSPPYMSPEQAAGRWEQVDARSDVYGLGAIMYELLVGAAPFAGRSIADVLRRVIDSEPVLPRARRHEIHPDIEAICLHAMEKDRAHRYASAAELAADLKRYLEGEPVRAARPSPWRHVRRWMRHRAVALALGAAAVVALVATAWLWRQKRTSDDAAREATARREAAESLARRREHLRELSPLFERLGRVRTHYRLAQFDAVAFDQDWRDLMADVERVRARLPDSPEPDHLAGLLHLERGNLRAAETSFHAALAIMGDFAPARVGLAQARLERLARSPATLVHSPEVRAIAEEIEKLEASSWLTRREIETVACLARAMQAVAEGNRDEAARLALDGWERLRDERLACIAATIYSLDGRTDEALRLFDAALATRPWLLIALVNRAAVYGDMGRLAEARQDLQRALIVDESLPLAHFTLGEIALKEGQIKEAEGLLTRAIELDPTNPNPWIARSAARRAMRDFENALADLDRAAGLRPEEGEVYAYRADVLMDAGDRDGAAANYERALRLQPDLPRALLGRGLMTLAGGNAEAALRDFDRVLSTTPGRADAHFNRGQALMMLMRLDEAERELRHAGDMRPDLRPAADVLLARIAEARRKP